MRLLLLSLLTVSVNADDADDADDYDDYDENTLFLIEKINIYVKNNYNGDYYKAISSFDINGDGKLDSNELWYALASMDIGTYMTRSVWVKGIMDYFGAISNSISTQQLLELTLTK